jgi:hypothetical protein
MRKVIEPGLKNRLVACGSGLRRLLLDRRASRRKRERDRAGQLGDCALRALSGEAKSTNHQSDARTAGPQT